MNQKIRVGIIGCGGIANGKHMPGLSKLENVAIVAFCDLVEEKANKAKTKFGTEDAKVYTDYKELLKDKTIEVIHVCTPNKSHSVITIDALESGKHVMCEKPMAKTSEEARQMVEAAKRTGKKLTVGYQNRYRSDSLYLKEVCQNEELGEVYFAKAHAVRRRAVPTWGVFLNEEEQGGGPLIDIGTHALDLTLWMMNNYKPKMVMGTAYKKLGHQTQTANAWGDWNQDEFTVEDSAFGFITMEDGATIILESSWALNTLEVGEAKTTLCGTKAGADMKDGLRINGVKYNKQYMEQPDFRVGGVDFYSGEEENPGDLEAKLWIEAVVEDKEVVVKPEEALIVTEILEAIYQSAATGEPVRLALSKNGGNAMQLGIIGWITQESFAKAKQRGLDFIELDVNNQAEVFLEHLEQIKIYQEHYEMPIAAIGRWGEDKLGSEGEILEEELTLECRLIDAAAALGCPVYMTGCNLVEGISYYDNVTGAIRYLEKLLAHGAAKGVKIATYNCRWNNFVHSEPAWTLIHGHLPELGIKYDPSHCIYDGSGDYLGEMKRWGHRFYHVHIKGSLKINGERVDDPPAGLDQTNWGAVMGVLYNKGYKGGLSIEPHSPTWAGELGQQGIDFTIRYMNQLIVSRGTGQ